jgi:hypothetical protein
VPAWLETPAASPASAPSPDDLAATAPFRLPGTEPPAPRTSDARPAPGPTARSAAVGPDRLAVPDSLFRAPDPTPVLRRDESDKLPADDLITTGVIEDSGTPADLTRRAARRDLRAILVVVLLVVVLVGGAAGALHWWL